MTAAAPLAGDDEMPDDVLSVSSVPTSRRSTPSAWEDGTPLRSRQGAVRGWELEPVADEHASLDATDLFVTARPAPAPAAITSAPAPTEAPVRVARALPRLSRTAVVTGVGLAVAAVVVWRFGTAVLPPLGAVLALAGLVSRARAGAR